MENKSVGELIDDVYRPKNKHRQAIEMYLEEIVQVEPQKLGLLFEGMNLEQTITKMLSVLKKLQPKSQPKFKHECQKLLSKVKLQEIPDELFSVPLSAEPKNIFRAIYPQAQLG